MIFCYCFFFMIFFYLVQLVQYKSALICSYFYNNLYCRMRICSRSLITPTTAKVSKPPKPYVRNSRTCAGSEYFFPCHRKFVPDRQRWRRGNGFALLSLIFNFIFLSLIWRPSNKFIIRDATHTCPNPYCVLRAAGALNTGN